MKRFTVKETDMHESEGGWPGKVEDAVTELQKRVGR